MEQVLSALVDASRSFSDEDFDDLQRDLLAMIDERSERCATARAVVYQGNYTVMPLPGVTVTMPDPIDAA